MQSEVGAQSIVITDNEIQTRQYNTAVEALAHQPGVILSQNSTAGPSSIFLRGANGYNTLVLVNGVPLGDPMGTGRMVDFSLLGSLLDVNRIEVLKGPQSALYGSSAMGGVIQIFTNDLNDKGTKLRVMAGSHETIQVSATTTGQVGKFRYSLGGLIENMGGIDISKRTNKPDQQYDTDRNKNRQLSGKFNYLINENFDIDLALTYNDRYSEYDSDFSNYYWNPYNDYNKTKLFTGVLALNGSFFEDQWTSKISYALTNINRDNYTSNDVFRFGDWINPVGAELAYYRFRGKTQTLNFDNELSFYKNFSTRFGFAYQKEQGSGSDRITHSQNTKSIYLEQSLDFEDKFFNTVGVRYDNTSMAGNKTTYRLTSRYNFSDIFALKGSFGTGFTAPNVYQIFDSFAGNRDLKPETSKGVDIGIELKPTSNSLVAISYFNTRYKNMFTNDISTNWIYENISKAKISGFELSGSIELNNQWALFGSYTYLDAKQKNTNGIYEKMLHRPKHQITANVTYKPIETLALSASAIYYGKRQDSKSGKDIELSSFALFDLAGSYKINRTFEVDAKIQNLFNKDYEFARGYREKGRTAYLGVNISL